VFLLVLVCKSAYDQVHFVLVLRGCKAVAHQDLLLQAP